MTYSIVNKSKGKVKVCRGKDELICYISSFNLKRRKEKQNLLLENVAMNKNDKKLKYDFYYNKNVLIPREYIVYDESGRIVDLRKFKDEILNYKADTSNKTWNQSTNCEITSVSTNAKAEVKPIARCGNKFRHYFRCPKTTNEKRYNAIPEYKQYVRGRRKVSHLPTAWDDYFVHTEKNWKRLKVRKQYMKNRFNVL